MCERRQRDRGWERHVYQRNYKRKQQNIEGVPCSFFIFFFVLALRREFLSVSQNVVHSHSHRVMKNRILHVPAATIQVSTYLMLFWIYVVFVSIYRYIFFSFSLNCINCMCVCRDYLTVWWFLIQLSLV